MIKKTFQKIILNILMRIKRVKNLLEYRKMLRITEDIINLPSKERKQALSKMRYRFRKNKKRGPFIYGWCDEIELFGKILDEQREKTGQQTRLNYRDMKKEFYQIKKFDSAK